MGPSFAACVLIELYTVKNNESEIPVVEIQYRNETSLIDGSNKLYPLGVPNCGFSCPLDKFVKLTEKRIPQDRVKECTIPFQESFIDRFKKVTGRIDIRVAAAIITVLLVLLTVLSVTVCCKRKKNQIHRHYDL